MGCCFSTCLNSMINNAGITPETIRKQGSVQLKYHQNRTGCCVARGLGALILTDDYLHFSLMGCDLELKMSLQAIENMEVTSSFRAKGIAVLGTKMLVIKFMDHNGETDMVVFASDQAVEWYESIQRASNIL